MNTPWEPSAIARYLTVGGATVDITVTSEPDTPYTRQETPGTTTTIHCIKVTVTATCQGCPATREQQCGDIHADALHRIEDSFLTEDARRWAQEHAEICRAMPKASQ
ncbi:hypothetical protein [Streptomyces sp. NPDC004376]